MGGAWRASRVHVCITTKSCQNASWLLWFWGETEMARDALREWRERYAENGTQLGFKPEAGARFSSAVRSICNAPRVVHATMSPGLLYRDRRMIADGDDNLSLVVSLGSELTVWHRSREIRLGRGEATVMQADAPGSSGTRRQFEVLEISISQREWGERGPRAADVLMRPISRNSDSLRLLLGYVRLVAKIGLSSSLETNAAVHRHLADLTVLAATAPSLGESGIDCVVAARRASVLEYVAAHFEDPDLSGASLARSLGISHRYLQRLLQETGKSFTEHVNDLRLQRAFSLLGAGGDRRVSDIAFEVGFSDLAHFYRLFKSRFGDTPKGVLGSMKAPRPS